MTLILLFKRVIETFVFGVEAFSVAMGRSSDFYRGASIELYQNLSSESYQYLSSEFSHSALYHGRPCFLKSILCFGAHHIVFDRVPKEQLDLK